MQCFQKSVCLLKNILSIVFSPQSPALFAEPLPGNPAFLAGPRPVSRHSLQGSPPCTRRPLLKKGSIRKLYLRADNMFLTERYRIRNAGAVDFWVTVYGYRSPSPLWVFCAFVHGGRHRRKPLGFRRCLPPARPEKAKPFQAGRSPCTKHPQDCPASPLRT